MTNDEAIQLVIDKGFQDGWAISNGILILWEHDEDPPPPLVRPTT